MKCILAKLSTLAVLGTIGFSTAGIAADQEQNLLELSTMTVTAEKREEKFQEVPATISLLSETVLEDAGVAKIRDIAAMVPNLRINAHNGWGYRLNYRGINWSPFTMKTPVVMYIDDVPYDEGNTFDGDFNNIERIEVLRGAQGILYGKNAIAGVINIISKTPENQAEGRVSADVGQHETMGVNAHYNGPLVDDQLYFGFSGSRHSTRGYLKNDHPDADYYGEESSTRAKGILRWVATERFEADLNVSIYMARNQAGAMISGTDYQDHAYRNPDDKNNSDTVQGALRLNYQGDSFNIKSITTARQSEKEFSSDVSYTGTTFVGQSDNSTINVLTQEIRFQSPEKKSGIKWLAGVFISDETKDQEEFSAEYNLGTIYKYDWPADFHDTTQSIFGQVTVPVTQQLKLTAGLRTENIHKTMDYAYRLTNTTTGALMGNESTYSVSKDWSAILPKTSLAYQIQPDKMLYASVAQGYLPGGFNMMASDKEKADFDAQYSTNYELGTKTSWLNNTLIFNAAVFYMDITDMHVKEYQSATFYYATNAGEARSQGIELEMFYMPVPGLNLSAALSQVDSKFVDYEGYDGNDVANTPEFTTNLAASYRHVSGIFTRFSFQGRGDAWANDANTIKEEGFCVTHAKIGYEKDNWDIYLQVKNLFDTEYLEGTHIMANGKVIVSTVGEPRTIGLVASARF